MLSRPQIEALIPHAGAMCLLDQVHSWDDQAISCSSIRHLRSDHPLRRGGRLSCVHLAEYAAQATALHAALSGGSSQSAPGVLASIRELMLAGAFFDQVAGAIDIRASRMLANDGGLMYEFSAQAMEGILASGRLSILIERT